MDILKFVKLDVPFYSCRGWNDEIISLKMVLAYYGKKISLNRIKRLGMKISSTRGLGILGLAKAIVDLGLKVDLYGFDKTENEEAYTKPIISDREGNLLKLYQFCKFNENINSQRENISLDDLLAFLDKGLPPIVFLDYRVLFDNLSFGNKFDIKSERNYAPLIGYSNHNVYIHQPLQPYAKEHFKIESEKFVRAWTIYNKYDKRVENTTLVVHR